MEKTPKLSMPGNSGVAGPNKITVYVVKTPVGGEGELLLSWKEEGGDILNTEVEATNSSNPEDYGLSAPPGHGVWAFEGTIKLVFGQCNHPLDPPEYDHDIQWDGEWRPPTDEESSRWAARKPKHTSYTREEDGSFSFQCPGSKDAPGLKDGWKLFCLLKRGHEGEHDFGGKTIPDETVEAVEENYEQVDK